jgi:sulfite exporter TauE/SafE
MCGGFAAACGGAGKGVPWHAGRLTTYAALGALAGTFGRILPGPGWVAAVVSAGLLVWFSAALAGLVKEPTLRIPGLARLAGKAARGEGPAPRYLLGLTTGLLPCGLVYAALAIPVASGSALVGALSMVAFGVGTAPALLITAAGARRLTLRSMTLRRVLAAGVLVLGLASVGMRQGVAGLGGAMDHGAHAAPAAQVPAEDGGSDPTSPSSPAHGHGG